MIRQLLSPGSSSYFDFVSDYHGDIVVASDFEAEITAEKYFGVQGESHLVGAPAGRDLVCEYMLTGYASATLLGAAMQTISAQIGLLTGPVSILNVNLAGTFNNCTFMGYRTQPRFYDGSGVNGWCVIGQLIWRQRKP